MSESLKLSPNCILNAPFQTYNNDFMFLVNDMQYPVSRFEADLLSPIVAKLHLNDPTVCQFEIKTKSPGNFQIILDLLKFQDIKIPENEIPFIYEVLSRLQNHDILLHNNSTIICKDNAIDNLIKHEPYQFFTGISSKEIDFISEHFYELVDNDIQRNKLSKLTKETLTRIFSNSKLRLYNEDQLLNYINELFEMNKDYSTFYSFVNFLNVSSESISEFLLRFDISFLDELWTSLSNRLKLSIPKKDNSNKKYVSKAKENAIKGNQSLEIPYGTDFEGIFFNLLRKTANISNEINVTVSSNSRDSYVLNDLIDSRTDSVFMSFDLPNSWIMFDFKKTLLIPSAYSIREKKGYCKMKSWKIEGSNNKVDWKLLDEQKEVEFSSLSRTFQMQNDYEPFQYIRLVLTGLNTNANHILVLDSIEFYGTLLYL